MKKKITIIAALIVIAALFVNPFSGRKQTLYNIAKELSFGMTQEQVNSVIDKYDESYLHRHESQDRIILRVNLGITDSCLLSIRLTKGKLTSARIRGEDGPHETFSDAPPDIEMNLNFRP